MDGWMDGGNCNIPDAFLKKRGDNYTARNLEDEKWHIHVHVGLFSLNRPSIIFRG